MKVINIKNENSQTKDLLKWWKKTSKHPCEETLELFTCKNTKVQGVKYVRSNKQIIKNLLYVMLMNLEFLSAIFEKNLEKKVFLNIKSFFCN